MGRPAIERWDQRITHDVFRGLARPIIFGVIMPQLATRFPRYLVLRRTLSGKLLIPLAV